MPDHPRRTRSPTGTHTTRTCCHCSTHRDMSSRHNRWRCPRHRRARRILPPLPRPSRTGLAPQSARSSDARIASDAASVAASTRDAGSRCPANTGGSPPFASRPCSRASIGGDGASSAAGASIARNGLGRAGQGYERKRNDDQKGCELWCIHGDPVIGRPSREVAFSRLGSDQDHSMKYTSSTQMSVVRGGPASGVSFRWACQLMP